MNSSDKKSLYMLLGTATAIMGLAVLGRRSIMAAGAPGGGGHGGGGHSGGGGGSHSGGSPGHGGHWGSGGGSWGKGNGHWGRSRGGWGGYGWGGWYGWYPYWSLTTWSDAVVQFLGRAGYSCFAWNSLTPDQRLAEIMALILTGRTIREGGTVGPEYLAHPWFRSYATQFASAIDNGCK